MKASNAIVVALVTGSTLACGEVTNKAQPQPSEQRTRNRHHLETPSTGNATSQIKAWKTPMGDVVVIDGAANNTPGNALIDHSLLLRARTGSNGKDNFQFTVVDFDTNGKSGADYRVTRMVLREGFYSCQHILLDFTGQAPWISERFPANVPEDGKCLELSWVRWEPPYPFFYFGGEVHPYVMAYNQKLKKVVGPVDAPPHPKGASLSPAPKPR